MNASVILGLPRPSFSSIRVQLLRVHLSRLQQARGLRARGDDDVRTRKDRA